MLNRNRSGTTSLQERNWAEAEDDALYDVVDEAQYNELRNSRLKCVCSFTYPKPKTTLALHCDAGAVTLGFRGSPSPR